MSPSFSALVSPLLAQSPGDQITTHRTGFTGRVDAPIEIIISGLLGSVVGFFVGMTLSAIVRVVWIDRVQSSRMRAGWGAYGAVAGGIVMAIWKAVA